MHVMPHLRAHITGASGTGVTTLGRTLAIRTAHPHFDADDFYWLPTNPPFEQKRDPAERLRLVHELFAGRPDWILSGSLDGWGDSLVPLFDLVVFLEAPTEVRLARLRARETRHFGAAAVGPGGPRHREFEEFIEWASHYEDGTREGRSRARHEAWLAKLPCRVLRLDSSAPVDALVDRVMDECGLAR
jgi:adenylate kinase family enzyme